MLFTIADPGLNPVFKLIRGRVAIFNEFAREIAERHDATLVDMWRMRGWKVSEIMDVDRLHLNAAGHQLMAISVLDALGVPHGLEPLPITAPDVSTARAALRTNAVWVREHAVPWVGRRLTGKSSGDGIDPKRPTLEPIK